MLSNEIMKAIFEKEWNVTNILYAHFTKMDRVGNRPKSESFSLDIFDEIKDYV